MKGERRYQLELSESQLQLAQVAIWELERAARLTVTQVRCLKLRRELANQALVSHGLQPRPPSLLRRLRMGFLGLLALSGCLSPEPSVCKMVGDVVVVNESQGLARCGILDQAVRLSLHETVAAGIIRSTRADRELPNLTIRLIDGPPKFCGPNTGGCMIWEQQRTIGYYGPGSILMPNYWPEVNDPCLEAVLGHELVHWSLYVTDQDPDGNHTNPAYWGNGDTVEGRGREAIRRVCAGETL